MTEEEQKKTALDTVTKMYEGCDSFDNDEFMELVKEIFNFLVKYCAA